MNLSSPHPTALAALASRMPAGAGLGLRPALWHHIIDDQHADDIDFLEVVVDDYLDLPVSDAVNLLKHVTSRFPIVAHGVCLSVASAEGVDVAYVERVARLLDALGVEIYSEHLSFRKAGGVTLGQFVPVPFTEKWAERVVANVRQVQAITGRTMLLENVSYLLGHPEEALGEPAFVSAVAEGADCGILLDVTNVLTNGANLGYSPRAYVDALPKDRILQAHIAGGHVDATSQIYVDSHGHPVPEAALALLAYAAQDTPLKAALLERDKHFPPFDELCQELADVRSALALGAAGEGAKEAPGGQGRAASEDIAYISLRPRPVASGAIPAVDEISAEALQTQLAEALSVPGRYKALREAPPAADDTSEEALIHGYLLSFPAPHVKAFAKILQFKRRELITGMLHGVCRHLEASGRLVDLLGLYFMECSDQGLAKLDDVVGFVDFLQGQEGLPRPLRDLALHERAGLMLRAVPYRFWHPWTRRVTLSLHCHPRALDAAVHGDLPAPLEAPIAVRYIRKRRGVWVEPLA